MTPTLKASSPSRNAACVLFTLFACACQQAQTGAEPALVPARVVSSDAPAPVLAANPERGRELFVAQCVVCHGEQGRGDGTAAYLLSPKPRDFGSARFRLVSTENGVPTDDDLLATLARGMPGSAMPPFEWLPPADLASLATHVRTLAIEGHVRILLEKAQADEEELSPAEALEIATRRMQPGPPLETGQEVGRDPQVLARGKQLFLESCALCHGEDGAGKKVQDQWNEDGTPNQPRDFTAGIFKGGSRQDDLVRRLRAGLPGSPMPAASALSVADARAVACYVQTLVPQGAQEKFEQRRRTLAVKRVRGALPSGAQDPAWKTAEPAYLALMPLWWHDGCIEGVTVRALHNGEKLALRISWDDPTQDGEILGHETFSDAASVQLAAQADAPLFTMGAPGAPVNLWQWKAAWERDSERALDVADRFPNMPSEDYAMLAAADVPLYVTARAVGNGQSLERRASAGEALVAEGFGTLEPLVRGGAPLEARGTWSSGAWDVAFVRPLAGGPQRELALVPGARAYAAFAVWDGSAAERNGQKAVTVWHVLEFER